MEPDRQIYQEELDRLIYQEDEEEELYREELSLAELSRARLSARLAEHQQEEPYAARPVALVLAALEQEPADAARRCLDRKRRSLPD